MRVKLDENLPAALCAALSRLGHDVDTVLTEELGGCPDDEVWAAAQDSGRFFITQDLDFSDLRRYVFRPHNGVMLVRLREPGRSALLTRIASVFEAEDVADMAGCFVVVTDHKIRLRRPD